MKHWFQEWNTRGKVVAWEIKNSSPQRKIRQSLSGISKMKWTIGSIEEFDGISLIEWTDENKIKSLKEFGCNLNHYNPDEHRDTPTLEMKRQLF